MPASATTRTDVPLKILHVEDNRENRMLVRAILEAEGYVIVDAEDGLSGIEAAIREQPDLILLDVNLPGVDGYEVVAIIKSFPNFATTPVIAVTAYAMEGDRQRTLVAGCDGYMQKPIDVDEFPRQVSEFLRGKREHVEEREEPIYLRELNQRLVYRLVNQVEELKRLNQHFVRRATQLAELHRAVQGITSEVGVSALLERLLPQLGRALGSTSLVVELADPPGVRVAYAGDGAERPRSVLGGAQDGVEDWVDVEWTLPLAVRGRDLGTITARHYLPAGAKADEEQLFNIVANQLAIAVENSRLYQHTTHAYEETQQQLRNTETLLSVSQAVSSTLDLGETMRRVAKATAKALGADMVGAYLADAESQLLSPIAGYRVPEHLRAFTPIPLAGHAFLQEAWASHEPVATTDAEADLRVERGTWQRFQSRSVVFIPMMLKGEPIGGLFAVWVEKSRAVEPEELRLVQGIASQAAIAIENSRLYEGVKHQMAELKQTQAQLIQSTKLAAIGELAANIAHEINNPLTTVLGFASFLAERLEPGAPGKEELGLIQDEATRARDIVRDLLQFSRQNEFLPAMTDLNVVVEQVVGMMKRQGVVDRIEVTETYAADLPLVEIDVGRIKQVLLNVLNNAVYAMPDGGRLGVRTSAAQGWVHIAFQDTGSGIAAENLARIFDPFFTTKPEVSGTGLGLSVSLGIIQSHGGTIDVESALGHGSTFTVKLPVERRPPTTVTES